MLQFQLNLRTATPLHIVSSSLPVDPLNYFLDDSRGELVFIKRTKLLQALQESNTTAFTRVLSLARRREEGYVSEIQAIYAKSSYHPFEEFRLALSSSGLGAYRAAIRPELAMRNDTMKRLQDRLKSRSDGNEPRRSGGNFRESPRIVEVPPLFGTLRDGRGELYLPGSMIKGALRVALCNAALNALIEANGRSIMEKLPNESRALEQHLLWYFFLEEEISKDRVMEELGSERFDPLSMVRISDAYPLGSQETEAFSLGNASRYYEWASKGVSFRARLTVTAVQSEKGVLYFKDANSFVSRLVRFLDVIKLFPTEYSFEEKSYLRMGGFLPRFASQILSVTTAARERDIGGSFGLLEFTLQ
jgi:hypothetical protein